MYVVVLDIKQIDRYVKQVLVFLIKPQTGLQVATQNIEAIKRKPLETMRINFKAYQI